MKGRNWSHSIFVVAVCVVTSVVARADYAPDGTGHWAFQPVVKPAVPEVEDGAWVRQPLDAFVLRAMEAEGIRPSPEASPRDLALRVAYDLTGLRLPYEDVATFVPADYAALVDRLLASERYGERWGRHWLDVARYADTKGYLAGGVERRFPFSYTYRDWVIRALNDDLPYSDFLEYQLAADRLVARGEAGREHLAALGYLTLGRRFLNNPHDIIDDRIDVVTRGMQGLTVACARCHDHKTDPVPMRDYYSLYGVFASSEEPAEKPLVGDAPPGKAADAFRKKLAETEAEVEAFLQARLDESRSSAKISAYLQAAAEVWGKDGEAVRRVTDERKLYRGLVTRWRDFLKAGGEDAHGGVFGAWHRLREAGDGFAEAASAQWEGGASAGLLGDAPPATFTELCDRYGKSLADLFVAGGSGDGPFRELAQALASSAPTSLTTAQIRGLLHRGDRNEFQKVLNKVARLETTHPGSPPRAMALVDRAQPRNVPVFLRGNPYSHGEEAPRRYLEILSQGDRPLFSDGSGRLEMAREITRAQNPLTARVMVNRVWGWHFGRPLVDTPSDFGLQTPEPLHRELLDYLAATFVEDGWSLKRLHRRIVHSSTYRQASALRADLMERDPENRLHWRMERRRKEFEGMRDGVLQVTGSLDLTMGGHPVDIAAKPSSGRRSVYAFIDRQNLPGVFRTFDFANPDSHNPGRFETTVPQQALFLMNNPFLVEQAGVLTQREGFRDTNGAERVRWVYRNVLSRDPLEPEIELALAFVAKPADGAAWEYGYGAIEEGEAHFSRYPAWEKGAWRGGAALPDAKLGWSMVNENGGHPGRAGFASMRRWHASEPGDYQVRGRVERPSEQGDGVDVIITNGEGYEQRWEVPPGGDVVINSAEIPIGDGGAVTIAVTCRADVGHDSYLGEFAIRKVGRTGVAAHSSRDFRGPAALGNWEKLVQVLLASNEFAFVD